MNGLAKKKSKSLKSLSSISRVKESVRNASQKKNEFLRKLQEIEQISVSKKVKEIINYRTGTDSARNIWMGRTIRFVSHTLKSY